MGKKGEKKMQGAGFNFAVLQICTHSDSKAVKEGTHVVTCERCQQCEWCKLPILKNKKTEHAITCPHRPAEKPAGPTVQEAVDNHVFPITVA